VIYAKKDRDDLWNKGFYSLLTLRQTFGSGFFVSKLPKTLDCCFSALSSHHTVEFNPERPSQVVDDIEQRMCFTTLGGVVWLFYLDHYKHPGIE